MFKTCGRSDAEGDYFVSLPRWKFFQRIITGEGSAASRKRAHFAEMPHERWSRRRRRRSSRKSGGSAPAVITTRRFTRLRPAVVLSRRRCVPVVRVLRPPCRQHGRVEARGSPQVQTRFAVRRVSAAESQRENRKCLHHKKMSVGINSSGSYRGRGVR